MNTSSSNGPFPENLDDEQLEGMIRQVLRQSPLSIANPLLFAKQFQEENKVILSEQNCNEPVQENPQSEAGRTSSHTPGPNHGPTVPVTIGFSEQTWSKAWVSKILTVAAMLMFGVIVTVIALQYSAVVATPSLEDRKAISRAEKAGELSAIAESEESKAEKQQEHIRDMLFTEIRQRLVNSIEFIPAPQKAGMAARLHLDTTIIQNLCRKGQYDKDGTLIGPVFGVFPEYEARPTNQLLAELAARSSGTSKAKLQDLSVSISEFIGQHYGFGDKAVSTFEEAVMKRYPEFIKALDEAR